MKFFDFFRRDPVAASVPRARKAPSFRLAKRAFEGAKTTRLNARLPTMAVALNKELRAALIPLKARSRWLAQNEGYARHFFKMVRRNVIGPQGILLEMKARTPKGDLDRNANNKIQEAFKDWGKFGVPTMDGRLSWRGFQNVLTETVARDGEVLVRLVSGAPNKFNFAVQLYSCDLLDVGLSRDLQGGRKIRMGVELDEWNKTTAYYLLDNRGADQSFNFAGKKYIRVPAEEMRLCFIAEDPDQLRGIPWIHAAITRLDQLNGFEDAALVNARAGANKLGFITRSEFDDDPMGPSPDYEEDEDGLIEDLEAGTTERLKPGESFVGFDPSFPSGETLPFVKGQLRGAASSLDVSYNSLGQDAEGVNYSSLRHFANEDRDAWMMIQEFIVETVLDFVFEPWLKHAMLSDQVKLPFSKFDQFNKPTWRPRRWKWVDPVKEQAANEKSLAMKTRSRRQIAAEEGHSLDDVLEEIRAEEEEMRRLGISVDAASVAKEEATDEPEEDDD